MAVSVPPHYLPTLLSPPLLKHADYTKLQKIPGKSRYFSRQISDTWGAGTGKLRLRHSGLSVNAGSKGEERGALGGEVIKVKTISRMGGGRGEEISTECVSAICDGFGDIFRLGCGFVEFDPIGMGNVYACYT
eukprot:1332749-Amorphochlora_amoeboformis.AAC.1